MNEVVNWLANKSVSRVLNAKKFVAIDFQTASGGGAVRRIGFVEPFQRAAGWIKLIWVRLAHWINSGLGCRHVRVAAQIMFGHRKMPDQRAVIAAKPISEIISHAALLAQAT